MLLLLPSLTYHLVIDNPWYDILNEFNREKEIGSINIILLIPYCNHTQIIRMLQVSWEFLDTLHSETAYLGFFPINVSCYPILYDHFMILCDMFPLCWYFYNRLYIYKTSQKHMLLYIYSWCSVFHHQMLINIVD